MNVEHYSVSSERRAGRAEHARARLAGQALAGQAITGQAITGQAIEAPPQALKEQEISGRVPLKPRAGEAQSCEQSGPDRAAAWARIRTELEQELGGRVFDAWIKPLAIDAETAAQRLTLLAPSSHDRDYVRTHYWHRIAAHVGARGFEPALSVQAARTQAPVAASAPRAVESGQESKPHHETDDDAPQFSAFVVSDTNHAAFLQMQRVGAGMALASPIILLHGDRGLGKTHLARAAARELQRAGARKALYLTAAEFRDRFVAASMKGDFADFKRQTREADTLIIDDLHAIIGSAGTQEELFHAIRAVTGRTGGQAGLVVLISDAPPAKLNGLNGQLAGDLEGALLLEIGAPDLEARRAIAAAITDRLARNAPNFAIEGALLDYLAAKVASTGRAICGAVYSIFAKTLNGEQNVTRQMIDDVLRNHGMAEKRVTIDLVQRVICEHFGVSRADLESPRRHAHIAHIRQVAMYLCRDMTSHGFPMIGSKFGKRHHSTVIYSCNLVEKSLEADNAARREVDQLRQMVRNRA